MARSGSSPGSTTTPRATSSSVSSRRSGSGSTLIDWSRDVQDSLVAWIEQVGGARLALGLAIVIAIYRNKKTPLVDEYDAMRQ